MSRPIQAFNPGFLGLLGLKNQGQNPPELIDQVQPTIDINQFYQMGLRESIRYDALSFDVASIGGHLVVDPELTVPAGQMWWLHGAHCIIQLAANRFWGGKLAHVERSTLPIHWSEKNEYILQQSSIAGNYQININLGGFFMLPGDTFIVYTEFWDGLGTADAAVTATISRFPL
jgi:hypothetical protein